MSSVTLYVGRLPARVRRRRTFWAVAGVAAALCGVVVVAVLALGGSGARGAEPRPSAHALDPELARRFAAAQAAAAKDGVELTLTSGWRSADEQQALVDDAIERYGSEQEAHRWVLPPETSGHVRGTAIDVGPTDGALWLGEHGVELGLCRAYANELWHFEMLADDAVECPAMHPDSSSGWG